MQVSVGSGARSCGGAGTIVCGSLAGDLAGRMQLGLDARLIQIRRRVPGRSPALVPERTTWSAGGGAGSCAEAPARWMLRYTLERPTSKAWARSRWCACRRAGAQREASSCSGLSLSGLPRSQHLALVTVMLPREAIMVRTVNKQPTDRVGRTVYRAAELEPDATGWSVHRRCRGRRRRLLSGRAGELGDYEVSPCAWQATSASRRPGRARVRRSNRSRPRSGRARRPGLRGPVAAP